MNKTHEQIQKEMKLKRESEAAAFRRVFSSEDGMKVLTHLSEVFGMDKPAFLPNHLGGYDPTHAAMRDGQRSVLLHIAEIMKPKE
jgi:hypothetical protein